MDLCKVIDRVYRNIKYKTKLHDPHLLQHVILHTISDQLVRDFNHIY